ncbi:CGNR zinc finger domain-containing protein [Streptomyces sp. CH-036]|uniref:CGNR zinc finger domain-containing protein n=1 Tax=Streptomyces sp. CH-036 TaxID=3406733 RepID=UPI003C776A7E
MPWSTTTSPLPPSGKPCAGTWCWPARLPFCPPAFPLRWQPGTDHLDDLRHALALRTEDLLSGDGLGRVRRCEGPGCGWFFLDRSRRGTRRWCSSQDCGNRDRARRHYSRTRQRG